MRRVEFEVGVDGGSILLASSERNMEKAGDFYGKIQDLTGWSADSVWDGKRGGIGTPVGDGLHLVVYDPSAKPDHRAHRDLRSAVLINRSPRFDPPAPGFTLYLGDSGRIDGAIQIPSHHYLAGVWLDSNTLQIFTE